MSSVQLLTAGHSPTNAPTQKKNIAQHWSTSNPPFSSLHPPAVNTQQHNTNSHNQQRRCQTTYSGQTMQATATQRVRWRASSSGRWPYAAARNWREYGEHAGWFCVSGFVCVHAAVGRRCWVCASVCESNIEHCNRQAESQAACQDSYVGLKGSSGPPYNTQSMG